MTKGLRCSVIPPRRTDIVGHLNQDADCSCILAHGHLKHHIFRVGSNIFAWETDWDCDCEACQDGDGDYCYDHWEITESQIPKESLPQT